MSSSKARNISQVNNPDGSSLVGYLPAGTGAVATTVQGKLRLDVNVFDFMSAAQIADVQGNTVSIDVTTAINNAITALGGIGGTVRFPAGRYLVSSQISIPSGAIIIGEGYQGGTSAQREGATTIWAVHSGASIFSLAGSVGCTIQDICLESGSVTYPKTALLLGRTSAASASYHKISRVSVFGYFSVAAVYSIASEDNLWEFLMVWIFGGGAKYCFYTGCADLLSVASLVTSTNLDNTLIRPFFINTSTSATSACVYMETSNQMGSWTFIGGYMTAFAGSYIQMNNSQVDGSALGPFTFVGTSGEILSGGAPTYAFNLSGSAAVSIIGLTITGARFALVSGTALPIPGNLFYLAPTLYLTNPNIVLQLPDIYPYPLVTLNRSQVSGGIVDIGQSSRWIAPTLTAPWANSYGAPYATAGYAVDANGVVRLRGTLSGSLGSIFTLPVGYRPSVNQFFMVYASGGIGRVLITAATGVVNLTAGTATEVDLSSIQFKIDGANQI